MRNCNRRKNFTLEEAGKGTAFLEKCSLNQELWVELPREKYQLWLPHISWWFLRLWFNSFTGSSCTPCHCVLGDAFVSVTWDQRTLTNILIQLIQTNSINSKVELIWRWASVIGGIKVYCFFSLIFLKLRPEQLSCQT